MNTLEKNFVLDSYSKIASHFSMTRTYFWPGVIHFFDYIPNNAIVADIGCGNGKNMDVPSKFKSENKSENKNIQFVGCDIVPELLDICKDKSKHVIRANNICLPFRNNSFDAVLSIAVIHHLSSFESRKTAVQELFRICKPGGVIMIQVWAFEQKTSYNKVFTNMGDNIVPWTLQTRFNNGEEEIKISRYYFIHNKTMFHELITNSLMKFGVDCYDIISFFYQRGNWVIYIRKIY